MKNSKFYNIFLEEKKTVDKIIRDEFEKKKESVYPLLFKAMEYSLFSGGKRVRPILLKWCAALGDPDEDVLNKTIAAIEYVHTYSIIHDDLPSMDNDNIRRGRPTSHRKFGEAMAILAGDALLTEAFHLLGETQNSRLSLELARYSGAGGMVAGQAADINKDEDMEFINNLKTACLFKASVIMGGIVGRLNKRIIDKLSIYGINLGRAFQLKDDLLDMDAEDLQKTRKKVTEFTDTALKSIVDVDGTERLEDLAEFVITRKK